MNFYRNICDVCLLLWPIIFLLFKLSTTTTYLNQKFNKLFSSMFNFFFSIWRMFLNFGDNVISFKSIIKIRINAVGLKTRAQSSLAKNIYWIFHSHRTFSFYTKLHPTKDVVKLVFFWIQWCERNTCTKSHLFILSFAMHSK